MEKHNLNDYTQTSQCSTSNVLTNDSVASMSLKKLNFDSTTVKKPVFVTLKKTSNGYAIYNQMSSKSTPKNSVHQLNLSPISSINKQQHSSSLHSDTVEPYSQAMVKSHSSRQLHISNDSRKCGVRVQHKKTSTLKKKSPLSTTTVSQILTQNGFYRLPNGKLVASAIQRPLSAVSANQIAKSSVTGIPISNASSSPITKYNFPAPPKKIDFKIVTKTQFATAVDSQPTTSKAAYCPMQSGPLPLQPVQNPLEFSSNGVPRDCQSFRKININVNNAMQKTSEPNESIVPISRNVLRLAPKPVTISNSLFNDEHEELQDIPGEDPDVNLASTTSTTGQNNTVEDLIKRMLNVEKAQIASSKQGCEVLIAVKKIGKNMARLVKYADDNDDELRRLLPIRRYEDLILFDQRIIDDVDFRRKVLLYLRGYKNPGVPDNFSSVLRRIMTDDLIYEFNLKGIMRKLCLENFKFMDVIYDIYKPMDELTFKNKMQKTLTMAKNRQNSANFRSRRRLNAN